MQGFLLLSCFVLVAAESVLATAHMIPEEKLSNNRAVALSQNLAVNPPPVVIVELPTTPRKTKKPKRQRKNKTGAKKRPSPAANCVPLGGNCKSSGIACCDYCAFCQCRLFRTVCYCRMGNPYCS